MVHPDLLPMQRPPLRAAPLRRVLPRTRMRSPPPPRPPAALSAQPLWRPLPAMVQLHQRQLKAAPRARQRER